VTPNKFPTSDFEDAPKLQRPQQELSAYDYRADAALPYYERHPEHKPKPWRRGQLRRRARMIRESL
jgi:hypothetical protein